MNEHKPYGNREIDQKFELIIGKLESIHTEVKLTNGRVIKLESRTDDLDDWKSFTKGAISVLTVLVVPILIYFITNMIR